MKREREREVCTHCFKAINLNCMCFVALNKIEVIRFEPIESRFRIIGFIGKRWMT